MTGRKDGQTTEKGAGKGIGEPVRGISVGSIDAGETETLALGVTDVADRDATAGEGQGEEKK